jgi:hypothetical protein
LSKGAVKILNVLPALYFAVAPLRKVLPVELQPTATPFCAPLIPIEPYCLVARVDLCD